MSVAPAGSPSPGSWSPPAGRERQRRCAYRDSSTRPRGVARDGCRCRDDRARDRALPRRRTCSGTAASTASSNSGGRSGRCSRSQERQGVGLAWDRAPRPRLALGAALVRPRALALGDDARRGGAAVARRAALRARPRPSAARVRDRSARSTRSRTSMSAIRATAAALRWVRTNLDARVSTRCVEAVGRVVRGGKHRSRPRAGVPTLLGWPGPPGAVARPGARRGAPVHRRPGIPRGRHAAYTGIPLPTSASRTSTSGARNGGSMVRMSPTASRAGPWRSRRRACGSSTVPTGGSP